MPSRISGNILKSQIRNYALQEGRGNLVEDKITGNYLRLFGHVQQN